MPKSLWPGRRPERCCSHCSPSPSPAPRDTSTMRWAAGRRLTWRPGTLRCNRLYLLFAIRGGLQYVPCFDEGRLVTRFLPHAISYGGRNCWV